MAFVGREVHLGNRLHDGTQRGAVVDFERGVAEQSLPVSVRPGSS